MTQCAICGEANALLFTCSHCDGEFCADHQFPHHACEKFTARSAAERAVDWVGGGADGSGDRPAASAAEEPERVTSSGSGDASADHGDRGGGPGTAGGVALDAERSSASETEPDRPAQSGVRMNAAGSPPEIEPIARDAARERRPDREGPTSPPPGRGWPSDRYDDRTVADWMREQSYLGYVAKVGSLSLLFTLAYYGGLLAVL